MPKYFEEVRESELPPGFWETYLELEATLVKSRLNLQWCFRLVTLLMLEGLLVTPETADDHIAVITAYLRAMVARNRTPWN